ncbi:hypothetical protein [Thermoflavimicrobium daqui]|uniref:Uncharacterized protein n=1 Tax=Thermoflavimicrobium daqui TaxID=2137476 RepID=A0A364K2R7_9BACL|nr:hypothetical protein [Thermoflavimicrobium daqui]RAL22714.1 hypothetical protein DL897_13700 [Thermoflavimicrobium daqui]
MYKLIVFIEDNNEFDQERLLIESVVPQLLTIPGIHKVNVNPLTGFRFKSPSDTKYRLQIEIYYTDKETFYTVTQHPLTQQLLNDYFQDITDETALYLAKETTYQR